MASASATVAKEKGNASFRTGNFADAVGHYSAAIVADRQDHTLPLNRAAAYLKLGKHRDAERDCTTVLSLDEKNVKALFRRAQARATLENLTEAEKDLKGALRLEPANDFIRQELAAVQKRRQEFSKEQPLSRREPITVSLPTSPRAGDKEDASPPKRATRKVPIEIVEGSDPPTAVISSSRDNFLEPRAPTLSSTSQPVYSPSLPQTSSPTSLASQTKPSVGAAIFRADGKYTVLRNPASSPSMSTSKPSSPSSTPSHDITSARTFFTHFAFSRAWYAVSAAHERYSLLLRIPPGSLPALFQTSLEPTLLVSIIEALSVVLSSMTSSIIAEYMDAFPAVPRFVTVVLLLDSKEKALVRRLLDALSDGHDARRNAWGL